MGIAAEAPRGGLVETIAGKPRILLLRLAEIERFEDRHRGIFAIYRGFIGSNTKPTSREVRDLCALGLVGGGMDDKDADALIAAMGPAGLPEFYQIAQCLVGVAFYPDWDDEQTGGDDPPEKPEGAATDSDSTSAPKSKPRHRQNTGQQKSGR